MPLPAWALLAVLLPHPDSYSFSELTVRGAEVRHRPVSYTHLTLPTIYSV